MQQSKKFMTKPLPVFLALMGMLMVACNTTNPTQPDITKKAPRLILLYQQIRLPSRPSTTYLLAWYS